MSETTTASLIQLWEPDRLESSSDGMYITSIATAPEMSVQ